MWIVAVGFQNDPTTNKPISPAVFVCDSEDMANREYDIAVKQKSSATMRFINDMGREYIIKDTDNEY